MDYAKRISGKNCLPPRRCTALSMLPKPAPSRTNTPNRRLVWFQTQPVSEKQRTAHERRTGRQEAPLRAIHKQHACAITEAEAFGKLLWATGCQANADRAKRLVMLGDGAPWIWNLVQTHFPQAIQIVDWYHAEEPLESVARRLF